MIEQWINDYNPDYANGSLEISVRILEAWAAGIDIEQFRPKVEAWIESIEVRPGIYRRSPHNPMQSSHDEWLGLAVLSRLYDLPVAKNILDRGLIFGLWFTGKAHDKILGFIPLDSEWIVGWRPEYLAIMKLAAFRELSKEEEYALNLNLLVSTTFNLLRVRLLFLTFIGKTGLEEYKKRLGDRYKGRYGDDKLMLELWKLNQGRYAPHENIGGI